MSEKKKPVLLSGQGIWETYYTPWTRISQQLVDWNILQMCLSLGIPFSFLSSWKTSTLPLSKRVMWKRSSYREYGALRFPTHLQNWPKDWVWEFTWSRYKSWASRTSPKIRVCEFRSKLTLYIKRRISTPSERHPQDKFSPCHVYQSHCGLLVLMLIAQ